jgi:hypothetical protein
MGQANTTEQQYKIDNFISFIHEMNIPVLDIGNTIGFTEYIDFINYDTISYPIMKGIDCYNRPFFVIRGTILFKDGSVCPTLETFFQRYTYNKYLWHGCGPFLIKYFMDTVGGMNIEQFKFLENLLKTRYVELTSEYMDDIKFGYNFTTCIESENETLYENNIIGFRIE